MITPPLQRTGVPPLPLAVPGLFSSTNSVNCAAAPDHTGNSGNYAWMDQSGTDAGVILETPDIDVSALTTPYLEFYYWLCGVGYSPANPLYIETYRLAPPG
ncbi:MAG: hypothetical protein U5L96_03080 [Owenweeksia sp.]|nr:hypothetical protein [Owenweeksia sp.]